MHNINQHESTASDRCLVPSVRAALQRLQPTSRERCARCGTLAPVGRINERSQAFCRACVSRGAAPPPAARGSSLTPAARSEIAYWRRRIDELARDY